MSEYIIRYSSIDGARVRKKFKTLKGAQKMAHYYLGEAPTFGGSYAVSDDGVGKIECYGCTLAELFPKGV